MSDAELKLITCVVQRGRADKICKAALAAGAAGATVFFARGMGIRERLGLLGLAVVPEKEVILILSPTTQVETIFNALVKAGNLDTPGFGLAFISDVANVAGLHPVDVVAAGANGQDGHREADLAAAAAEK